MIYAQVRGGQQLHLVFEAEGRVSRPICGKAVESYRMTSNMPLGHACKNCQRIFARNGGAKERERFFMSMARR